MPKVGSEKHEPYIAGTDEVGTSYRMRQVGKEIGKSKAGKFKEFTTATKKSYLHGYPFLIKSNSVRSLDA